jgi:hypothetical protein
MQMSSKGLAHGWLAIAAVGVGLAACGGRGALPPLQAGAVAGLASAGAKRAVAWGRVVDDTYTCTRGRKGGNPTCTDPTGKPLGHVLVQLEPWKPCRTVPPVPLPTPGGAKGTMWPPPSAWPQPETLVCPRAIVTTYTDDKGKFSLSGPPGRYLLVIGSDSTTHLRTTGTPKGSLGTWTSTFRPAFGMAGPASRADTPALKAEAE